MVAPIFVGLARCELLAVPRFIGESRCRGCRGKRRPGSWIDWLWSTPQGLWFAGSWAPSQQQQSIAYKELFLVVIAAHVWGHLWCKKHVLFRSDNDAVVHVLNSRTFKVPCLMRLLHSLLLAAALHSFSFSAQHVPGINNQTADALSRFCWQAFRQLVPEAQLHPTWIPPDLLADLTSLP